MFSYIFGFVESVLDDIRYRREASRPYPTPPAPAADVAPSPVTTNPVVPDSLQPIKHWSHPFGDQSSPFEQLTHLANARAGYYPLGRNGLWHGGGHFDAGTAGSLDQSRGRCLADGEVVVYRIPERTPVSTFFPQPGETVDAPFATGFVLVRHRLQAPKVEGSSDAPPELIFFSLYMHLQDWAHYQADSALERPTFWPERNLFVRADVSNTRPGTSTPKGLAVLTKPTEGGHMLLLDLLPPGTPVVVSGEGKYRKLEHSRGPASLSNADGSLRGYVAFRYLDHVEGSTYRVNGDNLKVRPTPDAGGTELFKLRQGTEVTISGEGEFRKLEHITQYVLAASLQGELAPQAGDEVVALDRPIPIKAGELIGHIGPYQESTEITPQEKLHLEVFSAADVEAFIDASRLWAARLPSNERTWLKFTKGTPVVAHQDTFSASRLPLLNYPHTCSGSDLYIPKSLLDSLSANHKIHLPANDGGNARTWYRIEKLFNGSDGALLDGWVLEDVGNTPWLNTWSWNGYETLYNRDSGRASLAFLLSIIGHFGEREREQFDPLAERSRQSLMRTRLLDIIDRNGDGDLTAEELQAALKTPAHAQSISQLVMHYESEWRYTAQKWDGLDDLLGHSNSTPILNWVAEKQRIKRLSWWGEVAPKIGLPKDGKVYHFHPVGLLGHFFMKDNCSCGCCLGQIFSSTRYGQQYGPVHWGSIKLSDFYGWGRLVSEGVATSVERDILVAMSENEGNLDAVQSYDSEILTAGAMQKTINPQGAGELPKQVYEFMLENRKLYQSLFAGCGWEVKAEGAKYYLYYKGVTGSELKTLLRRGFDQAAFERKEQLSSEPLAAFVNAITSKEYLAKQVIDFIKRLRVVVALRPVGYGTFSIGDYIHSKVGKAVVLDHHVNRPGYVAPDFGAALKNFILLNPGVSENPKVWGVDHHKYETKLLEIYGPSRRMTDAVNRYQSLKGKL